MKRSAAEILCEYGPFPDAAKVNGVTFDGRNVWFASGDRLNAFDPATGEIVRPIDAAAHPRRAFDDHHFYQIAGDGIRKIDPAPGTVLASIPAPSSAAGLTWAEGTLWVGDHRGRK